ncbi:hypothetical protein F2Q70_00037382 [Brassica cretica]|uniref:Uncharacterized protein n=1 Tax=Brassica cretica TaxID=69181 RepID=A0A8S9JYN4_BRACR|nr:hypothetical protein F2Q70_00037382 [Brassica cretica]
MQVNGWGMGRRDPLPLTSLRVVCYLQKVDRFVFHKHSKLPDISRQLLAQNQTVYLTWDYGSG